MTKKLLILSTVCLILTAIACSADTPTVRHTVTFLNADDSVFHKMQVEDNQTVNPPTEDPVPVIEGYLIKGWSMQEDGSELFDFSTPVRADIILYPVFASNLEYILKDDGTLSVKRYRNSSRVNVLTIPSEYEGIEITSIESEAFTQFQGNEIHIPASISSIGDHAFLMCSASIIVDEDNTNYTAVDDVLFNKDMTTLISCPISKSTADGNYKVPDSVTAISDYAFFLNSLNSISLHKNIQEIGVCAFSNWYGQLILDKDNTEYSFEEGVLFNKDKTTLISCTNRVSPYYKVPDTVTSIANYAFSYCTPLKEILLPKGISSIGESAFVNCFAQIILEEGTNEYILKDDVLFNKDMTTLISCTKSKEGSYNVPDTVTKIADTAFQDCYYLTEIHLPASLTEIGENVFVRTSSLTSITVDESNNNYASVDGVLFNKDKTILIQYPNAKAGTSYEIPNTVNTISELAFFGSDNLESLTIPGSVTTIGANAFRFAMYLTSIEIPESITAIPEGAFSYCFALSSVTLPSNLVSIGDEAFADCQALTTIEIPESVETISYTAFRFIEGNIEINVNKRKYSILGAPWGAENATVIWNQD